MKPYLQEKFSQPDIELFTTAACHVYAEALERRFGSNGFTLRRVALTKTFVSLPALHVCVAKEGTMMDVTGIHQEEKFIKDTSRVWTKPGDPAEVAVFDCTREELFTAIHRDDDDERGLRDKWDLHVDREFLAACQLRAEHHIAEKIALFTSVPS